MTAVAPPTRKKAHFYGWRIVGLGFLNNFMAVGVGTYAFAVLIKPMTEDPSLGWTRTQVVWAFTITIIVSTLTAPLVGYWLDTRHGARLFAVFMGLTGALGIALASTAQELWHLYLFIGIIAAILLHDPPFMLSATTVSKWFIRRRGMVLTISSMGISVGGLVFLPFTRVLVNSVGWRDTWLILGILIAIIVIPANALIMRSKPEDMGLRPDGDEAPPTWPPQPVSTPTAGEAEPNWTLRTAMKTGPFWILLVANNLSLAGIIGTVVNQVAYLDDELPNSTLAAGAVLALVIFSLLGKLPWIVLADRTNPRFTTIAMQLLCGTGMILLVNVSTPMAFAYAVVFGLGIGGFDPLISLLWANYFGRSFLGAIRGFITATNVVSFAGAPLFASFMFDTTGDYRNAFLIFAGAFFIGAALLFMVRKPTAPEAAPELAVSS